jgi:hypothetical protein
VISSPALLFSASTRSRRIRSDEVRKLGWESGFQLGLCLWRLTNDSLPRYWSVRGKPYLILIPRLSGDFSDPLSLSGLPGLWSLPDLNR